MKGFSTGGQIDLYWSYYYTTLYTPRAISSSKNPYVNADNNNFLVQNKYVELSGTGERENAAFPLIQTIHCCSDLLISITLGLVILKATASC